jgi:hypothetical protein
LHRESGHKGGTVRWPRSLFSLFSKALAATGRRSIGNVLAFDDHQLEHIHDFIQWLFPLPDPSRAQPPSSTLTSAEIAAIRQSSAAQENLKQAAQMMTDFYQRHDHWLRWADHNHLRITRSFGHLLCCREEK